MRDTPPASPAPSAPAIGASGGPGGAPPVAGVRHDRLDAFAISVMLSLCDAVNHMAGMVEDAKALQEKQHKAVLKACERPAESKAPDYDIEVIRDKAGKLTGAKAVAK